MAPRFTIFTLVHVLTWLFEPAVAGSIATWSTGLGAPQIIMQDDATGRIFYSLCNSNGTTPVFPANVSASFSFDSNLTPKNGTSLTGVGYADGGINIAAMWYQTARDQIAEALWKCDPTTGHFVAAAQPNQWIVSSDQPINSSTGLSAVNLGSDSGYRVYFHDDHMATSILRYTTADGWGVDGNISQDAVRTLPISAGFTDTSKITVVYGKGPGNIEVSTLQQNGEWAITTFPTPLNNVDRDNDNTTTTFPVTNNTAPEDFTLNTTSTVNWSLEGWDGSAKGIGLTFNDDSTRNIFYIGNDSLLHQISEVNGGWRASSGQSVQSWPTADDPNAQFATTFDFSRNQAWIYYVSGGNLTQVYQSSKNRWEPASTVPTFNDTMVTNGDNGLSTGAKAGIGVGVGVGCLALLAFSVFFSLRRKRGRQEKKQAEAEAETTAAAANQPHTLFPGSPAPTYSSGVVQGQWVDGQWMQAQPQTKPDGQWQERYSYLPVPDQQPMYHEMPNQERAHEVLGDTGRGELPTSHNELEEGRQEGRP
ncbi:hypothetical protein F4820DRAFT_449820 [Hypoxylon rubiginosum]|uniref:Uncharacterized protein n=1 Tax=Hypoxylon rubiginosum TaxID=110542 RepID=A0ACB9YY73_9PEZI|nr:hypothetical protein F4820DRAFT_449820 [Hypoxylon rubiginosum]